MLDQEETSKEKELILSVALLHDIFKRHANKDYETSSSRCHCAFCHKAIRSGKKVVLVKNFERNDLVVLCGQDCTDSHEYAEIVFFVSEKFDELPPFNKRVHHMGRDEIILGYLDRVKAKRQDFCDKIGEYKKSYQEKGELEV